MTDEPDSDPQKQGAITMRWVETVVSLWVWLVFGVTMLLAIPVMLILLLFTRRDPGRYLAGLAFRKVAVVTCGLNPLWRVRVTGVRIEDPRRPYVVVSNHESFVDILLLCNLPWEMKWLSKAEILRIPVLGWMMRLAGDISLDRDSRKSAVRAMERARQALKNRTSVMIFPEGTRSTDEDLLPFKDGAFRLAIKAGVPVLPLAIAGTRDALAKHDWRFSRAHAEVRVLPPVETKGLTLKDADALKERVRGMIAEARGQILSENSG